jgi:hypothetical protein
MTRFYMFDKNRGCPISIKIVKKSVTASPALQYIFDAGGEAVYLRIYRTNK